MLSFLVKRREVVKELVVRVVSLSVTGPLHPWSSPALPLPSHLAMGSLVQNEARFYITALQSPLLRASRGASVVLSPLQPSSPHPAPSLSLRTSW